MTRRSAPASSPLGGGADVPMATLLEDRNLDAMLSVMSARSGDLRLVERSDLRAAIVEVLGWEGIHA